MYRVHRTKIANVFTNEMFYSYNYNYSLKKDHPLLVGSSIAGSENFFTREESRFPPSSRWFTIHARTDDKPSRETTPAEFFSHRYPRNNTSNNRYNEHALNSGFHVAESLPREQRGHVSLSLSRLFNSSPRNIYRSLIEIGSFRAFVRAATMARFVISRPRGGRKKKGTTNVVQPLVCITIGSESFVHLAGCYASSIIRCRFAS